MELLERIIRKFLNIKFNRLKPNLCTYTCTTIITIHLALALPIIIKHPSSNICKIKNTECKLQCLATGVGHIQYKWEKYRSSIDRWITRSRRSASPKLNFSIITEKDEGDYRCIATNHDGIVVSNNATLTVYGRLVFSIQSTMLHL